VAEIIEVIISQETVNDESVRILLWNVASGSRVENEQLVCEVETSKAVVEIHSPAAGIIEYTATAGNEVPVGSVICRIIPTGASTAKAFPTNKKALAPEEAGLPPAEEAVDLPPARLSPLAQKVAAEYGIAPKSFPSGTVVRKDDVLRKAGKLPPAPAGVPEKVAIRKDIEKDACAGENAPVPGVLVDWAELPRRKIIEGRILGTGQASTVQSAITVSCQAGKLRERLDRMGFSVIGLNALVLFEAARLLRKYPAFNALHDRGRVGVYREINIGWAIDGGQGLVVPVVKQADSKSLREITGIMDLHVEAYVGSSLAPNDFLGGTFTVSDLSRDGVSFFQPLISRGQSAILGVGSDSNGADGELLYLTLAFDHQVAEGRMAARFLRELSRRLEAHAGLDGIGGAEAGASESELFCLLCQRDGETLRSLNACLVRSELPPGLICSICLMGF
jgi:pyruvate/2-oxoglutarate dehydrogenase complex dihydrolipoamide acyltransferase (E2) component